MNEFSKLFQTDEMCISYLLPGMTLVLRKLIVKSNGLLPAKIISSPKSLLYSVNIYKYDTWNGYSSILWHYLRSGIDRMINICRLSWPIFCWKSVQNPAYKSATVLFSDGWWCIRAGVLNYDTDFMATNFYGPGPLPYFFAISVAGNIVRKRGSPA